MKEIYFLKVSQLQLWHQPFCIGRLQSILRTYKQLQEHIDNRPYSQSYGLSSSHAWVWEQDHKEDWVPKNWCFRIVLQKTLESPLDCRKIIPGNPKGNQSWIFIGRTDAEAPIIWPPGAKSQLIGKDPDAGEDWRQKKRVAEDDMVR